MTRLKAAIGLLVFAAGAGLAIAGAAAPVLAAIPDIVRWFLQ